MLFDRIPSISLYRVLGRYLGTQSDNVSKLAVNLARGTKLQQAYNGEDLELHISSYPKVCATMEVR